MSISDRQYQILLNMIGGLSSGAGLVLLMDYRMVLWSMALIVFGMTLVGISYRKYKIGHPNGSLLSFIDPIEKGFTGEVDKDYAYYRAIGMGLLFTFLGIAISLEEASWYGYFSLFLGVLSFIHALRLKGSNA